MVHWIDVAHWFLDLDHPAVAASIGDHYHAEGLWETPDTVQTLLHYPRAKASRSTSRGRSATPATRRMFEFMGTEATLYIDRGRYEIHPERRSKLKPSELILGAGPRGADFYDQPDGELLHLTNWVECVRSRKTPACPAEAGVSAASAAHLANRSLRRGKMAKWERRAKE